MLKKGMTGCTNGMKGMPPARGLLVNGVFYLCKTSLDTLCKFPHYSSACLSSLLDMIETLPCYLVFFFFSRKNQGMTVNPLLSSVWLNISPYSLVEIKRVECRLCLGGSRCATLSQGVLWMLDLNCVGANQIHLWI